MKKRRQMTIASLFVILTAVAAIGLGSRAKGNQVVSLQGKPTIPEYVPYMFLFDQHYSNLLKADELEKHAHDGSQFHSMFQRNFVLTDAEASLFDQITRECEGALAQQDTAAQAVITTFRSRYPVGKLPDGVTLPPPPPELATMQETRNSIILAARDRLRAALGQREFARFDAFVQSNVTNRIGSIGSVPRPIGR